METVKAKIKGTNAILEGCVCDDSFFVSVDHDIFERYALCEVEICKDSLQVPETCKENQDSFTSLEEAADDYADKHGFRVPYDGSNNYYDDVDVKASKEGFIAGAEWQKEQMMKEAVEGRVHLMGFHNAIYSKEPDWTDYLDGFNEGDKVKIIIVKDDKGRND